MKQIYELHGLYLIEESTKIMDVEPEQYLVRSKHI